MDFNTTLLRFGLDSSNFVNKPVNVIKTQDGIIYEVEENYRSHICPKCNYQSISNNKNDNWLLLNTRSVPGIAI